MERFEHGGNVYDAPPAGGWLDFSANINPLGLAPEVREAIQGGIDDIIHYPDPGATRLKQAVSQHYGLPVGNILLGNGATEIFYLFFHMIQPRRAWIPIPSFNEYERAALSCGTEIHHYLMRAEDGFRLDLEGLVAEVRRGDVILLGNPNNPTGCVLERDRLARCMERLEAEGAWLLVDESFMEFRRDRKELSLHGLEERFRHLLVIESLTKFYAIPGLRLGFASGHKELLDKLDTGKDVWNVNSLAQRAGTVALGLTDYQEKTRAYVAAEAAYLKGRLEELGRERGFSSMEPSVNFFLLDIRNTGKRSREIVGAFRSRGILVRDCANYPGLPEEGFIRIAVRTRADNDRLLEVMEEIL